MKSSFRIYAICGLLAGLLSLFETTHAVAFETKVFDAYCNLKELPRPLRQTIVVLDQSAIGNEAANTIGSKNRHWINSIVTISGTQEGQANTVSAPREKIIVLVAASDGSDLVRVFSGCPPTFSAAEIALQEKGNSGVSGHLLSFIGRDFKSQMDGDLKNFRRTLLGALVEVVRSPELKANSSNRPERTFLDALAALGGAFDLAEGPPRIIIISPFNAPALKNLPDSRSAREAGFLAASKLGTDLQRSEIYVTGIARDASPYVRDFAQTFFLGLKGRLAATSGEALPPFAEPPSTIQVFGGFIDYGGVKAPIQLRVAIDRGGSLVNSWVEVALQKPIATALTGKAVCKSDRLDECEIRGDGKEFSQSWVVDVGPNPKFDASLPFSGLRYFELSTNSNSAKGKFYDPVVIINGQKELAFDLARTPGVRF